LYREGFHPLQIAEALGVSATVVWGDLHREKIYPRKGLPRYREEALLPIDWRAEANAAQQLKAGIHQGSLVMRLWRDTLRESQKANGLRRFAQDVKAAEEAGDEQWFLEQRRLLQELQEYLHELQRAAGDPEFRRELITHGRSVPISTPPGQNPEVSNNSKRLKPTTDLSVRIWNAVNVPNGLRFEQLLEQVGPYVDLEWARKRAEGQSRSPMSEPELREYAVEVKLSNMEKDGNVERRWAMNRPLKWRDTWVTGRKPRVVKRMSR
jgi:hypothetical protein